MYHLKSWPSSNSGLRSPSRPRAWSSSGTRWLTSPRSSGRTTGASRASCPRASTSGSRTRTSTSTSARTTEECTWGSARSRRTSGANKVHRVYRARPSLVIELEASFSLQELTVLLLQKRHYNPWEVLGKVSWRLWRLRREDEGGHSRGGESEHCRERGNSEKLKTRKRFPQKSVQALSGSYLNLFEPFFSGLKFIFSHTSSH